MYHICVSMIILLFCADREHVVFLEPPALFQVLAFPVSALSFLEFLPCQIFVSSQGSSWTSTCLVILLLAAKCSGDTRDFSRMWPGPHGFTMQCFPQLCEENGWSRDHSHSEKTKITKQSNYMLEKGEVEGREFLSKLVENLFLSWNPSATQQVAKKQGTQSCNYWWRAREVWICREHDHQR